MILRGVKVTSELHMHTCIQVLGANLNGKNLFMRILRDILIQEFKKKKKIVILCLSVTVLLQ